MKKEIKLPLWGGKLYKNQVLQLATINLWQKI
jgi:hypothetical protein